MGFVLSLIGIIAQSINIIQKEKSRLVACWTQRKIMTLDLAVSFRILTLSTLTLRPPPIPPWCRHRC